MRAQPSNPLKPRLERSIIKTILPVYHRRKADSPETALTIERTLFAAADKMRGAMDAGDYKHIALDLLFLRYLP